MKMDLHMHSNISLDGEFTPKELIALCKKNGVTIAALTDHNSVRGVEAFCNCAKEQDIQVITGIELDCVCEGVDLHLLGYGIDIRDRRFRENEDAILEQKRNSSARIMCILHELGIYFEDAAVMRLARDGVVVGETIAEVALQDDRNSKNPVMQPYYAGGERSDNPYVNFFWDFCSQGKPAYTPELYMSFAEAVSLIRESGGMPVIAHPKNTVGRREAMIADMVEKGVVGLEVYSSYHTAEDVQYYYQLADRMQLIKTVGSDFHGKTKPSVQLGNHLAKLGIKSEDEKRLMAFVTQCRR